MPGALTTLARLVPRQHRPPRTPLHLHASPAATRGARRRQGLGTMSRRPLRLSGVAPAAGPEDASGGLAPDQPSGSAAGVLLTVPTLLSLFRVACIPVLVGVWFSGWERSGLACGGLFLLASLTDFLDGYLARRLVRDMPFFWDLSKSITPFGVFLDPVADKLMVATVLVLLASRPVPPGAPLAGNTWLLPVLASVVIGREITMSALREWAASLGPAAYRSVAVSAGGKLKTAAQMGALTLLLLVSNGATGGDPLTRAAALLGLPLLGLATFLTVKSLLDYFAAVWKYF